MDAATADLMQHGVAVGAAFIGNLVGAFLAVSRHLKRHRADREAITEIQDYLRHRDGWRPVFRLGALRDVRAAVSEDGD